VTFEFHLTPEGWVEGTFLSCGHGSPKPRPVDAVETLHQHQTQSSIYSPTYCSQTCIWVNNEIPQVQRNALRAKFPTPFTESYAGPLGRQP
jgi:hypothetical protein